MPGTRRPCPRSVDRFDWSSHVLDEPARAVTALGPAVADVTGRDDEIGLRARELATANVRCRNDLLGGTHPRC